LDQVQNEIGQVRHVLFQYESKKQPGIYYGRTEHFRLVRVASQENLVGKLLPIHITNGNKVALVGTSV
jgi:tRNA-2-methylthio-N6-dimethylallyladenosine synthase